MADQKDFQSRLQRIQAKARVSPPVSRPNHGRKRHQHSGKEPARPGSLGKRLAVRVILPTFGFLALYVALDAKMQSASGMSYTSSFLSGTYLEDGIRSTMSEAQIRGMENDPELSLDKLRKQGHTNPELARLLLSN